MTTYLDLPKSSYSDTNNQPRAISDIIQMIDPVDTPVLDFFGGLDAARGKFRLNMNGTKLEWIEDEYMPLSTAMASVTISTTATAITVADASILKDGDVIQIDDEIMVVSAVDTTNNTINVYSRSYGGTNATHATTSTIYIMGQARLEGDDADYRGITQLTTPYNYTSIYEEGLKITGTEGAIDYIGFTDPFEYHANKKMKDIFRRVEKNFFYGIRAAGSATTPRSFGGLNNYISTNTTSTTALINKTLVDDLSETMMIAGANPDVMIVHPGTARDLKDIVDTANYMYTDQESGVVGRPPVQYIQSQFFRLRLLVSRFCPTNRAWMLDSSKIGFYTLRPFVWTPLAVTGDSRKADLVGEISLVVANNKAHGVLTGIST